MTFTFVSRSSKYIFCVKRHFTDLFCKLIYVMDQDNFRHNVHSPIVDKFAA